MKPQLIQGTPFSVLTEESPMSSTTSVLPTAAMPSSGAEKAKLYLFAFAIVVAAEFIGNVSIPLGPAKIVLLPLLWALLMGRPSV